MNVFTIPSSFSFVDALAEGLLARTNADPLTLSTITVLLPNRRACRNLREAFLRKSEGKSLLLPAIVPIGDVDEDAIALGPRMETLDMKVPVDPLFRQLVLAQFLCATDRERFTMAQALPMAADLGRFLDSAHTEGLSLEKLDNLVPEIYAEHWQRILKFLKGVLRVHWPAQLKRENALDPGEHRRRMIEAYTQNLRENPPIHPIIAAGSTGSIPATAELLKTIAGLEHGSVVLPGLDKILDDDSWAEIEEGHPQSGLANLLLKMDVARSQVKNWNESTATPREHLISAIMRPASTLDAWTKNPIPHEGFENLTLVEADTIDEEAAVIAGMMREHAGKTEATTPCVLVTPDRVLAFRVAEYLKRWNIAIDDSAGIKLNRTPVGAWLLLLAQTLHEQMAPIPLLALLKHPLAAGGAGWPKDAPAYRTFVRQLDLALRGPRPAPGFDGLHRALSNTDMTTGLRALERLFGPIGTKTSTPEKLRALIVLAEDLAGTPDRKGADRLWAGDAGEAAASAISSLFEQGDILPDLDWKDLHAVLDAAMEGVSVRPRFGTHPRLAILGPIEARLYQAQTMILGSLNEGTWPKLADVDGWMSRPMRAEFGLPAPERAITLTAHDFCQGMGAENVILTRSKMRDNAPTNPSRWLQRLEAVRNACQGPDIRTKGEALLRIARQLDIPNGPATPISQPQVNPPLESRPRSLRVTEIAALRKDPYSIYARHILKLRPLDPIDADPDARERGTLIHQALEEYTRQYPKDLPENLADKIITIGKKIFDDARPHPDVTGHWWPRFKRMASALAMHETAWRKNTVQTYAEVEGTLDIGGFTLKGRADRIEHRTNGWAVIDYKSGSAPSAGDVKSGDEPQLTLLGAMLLAGCFNETLGVTPKTLETMAYWPAGGNRDTFTPAHINGDVNTLAEEARAGLEATMRAYLVDGIPYICRPDPEKKIRDDDEYTHLERVTEWSSNDGEEAA